MFNFRKRRTNLDREWIQLINEKLTLIIYQNKIIMGELEQHQEALNRIEAATTKLGEGLITVAGRITSLEEKIKELGLPKEQEDALLARTVGLAANLEAQADALIQMGKSTDNPVPVEPTEPTEPTTPTV